MKGINTILIFTIGILLASCKADMICPAYQSYYLLDENTQRNQFSYFAEDSLPRKDVFYSTLDKNGLIAKTSLFAHVDRDWVRERELRTINMDVVYPILSDSILFAGDAMMYAETDVVDSVALDSARMAAQTFRYGADQKYYNWYFRGKLVWKDELEKEQIKDKDNEEEEKTGFFGFFKKLFKKKDKSVNNEEEQAALEGDSLEEGNPIAEEPEKGGFFKKLFSKKEKEPKEPKQPKQPKQKKEKAKKKKGEVLEEKVPDSPAKEEDDGEDDF